MALDIIHKFPDPDQKQHLQGCRDQCCEKQCDQNHIKGVTVFQKKGPNRFGWGIGDRAIVKRIDKIFKEMEHQKHRTNEI
ncbi:MAG: hypothetical protein EBT20_21110 [Alphaproteobacteria bacterium]|nr:hypothetical protein [Alphaproteobacteria bacterium]